MGVGLTQRRREIPIENRPLLFMSSPLKYGLTPAKSTQKEPFLHVRMVYYVWTAVTEPQAWTEQKQNRLLPKEVFLERHDALKTLLYSYLQHNPWLS